YSAEFIKNIIYFTGLSWLQPLELSASKSIVISASIIPMLAISLFIVFKLKNSNELSKYSNHRDASYDTSYAVVVLSAIALFISIISMFGGTTASNFIYATICGDRDCNKKNNCILNNSGTAIYYVYLYYIPAVRKSCSC